MNKYRVHISIKNDNPIIFDTNEETANIIIEAIKAKCDVIAISKVDILTIKI